MNALNAAQLMVIPGKFDVKSGLFVLNYGINEQIPNFTSDSTTPKI